MPFTPKTWVDAPSTSTPISAAALTDLETRVTTYAESPTVLRTIANMAGTQNVASGAAAAKATWDTEREDSLGSFTPTSGDFTIPAGQSGMYLVTVVPAWNTQSTTGVRAYHLQVAPAGVGANAVMLTAHHDAPSVYNGCYPFSWAGSLSAGDVLSVWIYHEAGVTIAWGGSSRPLTSLGQSRNCEICIVKLGT